MIARERLIGARVTLLLVGTGEEGREEAATFAGTVREADGALVFAREGGEALPFREEWLAKVEKVPEEGKGYLLGAEYYLTLETGPLGDVPEAADWAGIEVEFVPPGRH